METTVLKNIFTELGYSNISKRFIDIPNIMRINLSNNNNIYPYVDEYFYLDTTHSLFMKARNIEGEFSRKVPTEYKEVQYIESNGAQCINTGLYAESNDVIELCGNFTRIDKEQAMGGTHNSGNYRKLVWVITRNGQTMFTSSAGAWNEYTVTGDTTWAHAGKPVMTADTDEHIFKFDQADASITIDGTRYALTTGGTAPGQLRHFPLFCNYHDDENPASCAYFKFRYCKIWKGTTLVRNYVPVVRVEDDKPGLYDLVNKVFYVNIGTGKDFTYGEDKALEPDTIYEIVDVKDIVSIETRNTISASEFAGYLSEV